MAANQQISVVDRAVFMASLGGLDSGKFLSVLSAAQSGLPDCEWGYFVHKNNGLKRADINAR